MKLSIGSVVKVGPYKLVIIRNCLEDSWNLVGVYNGESIVALNYIDKDPHWDESLLTSAVDSGDFMLINTKDCKSVYDGRSEKGKYKIRQAK